MDSSQKDNYGLKSKAPSAAELQAFADAQTGVAGAKRTADEVSDMKAPEGSRPMLALDSVMGNRHRPNNPELLEASLTPLEPSCTLVTPPSNALSSALTPPPAATASPSAPGNLRRPNSERAPSQPITSLFGIDRKSPIVQSMLREAFNEGRSEGRQENKAKLDETQSKVEELRIKASNDRLAFESTCREKDQGIHDQQMAMARYQKELMARRRLILDLKQQASVANPQNPTNQHGLNILNQQILDAEARFGAQGQELAIAKSQNEVMRAQLINWQVQWGLIDADLKKSKAAFSKNVSELDACQRRLDNAVHELKKSKEEASQVAVTNSEQIGSLKAANTTLTKDAAERSAKLESVKTLKEKLESYLKQVKDGKDEISALTSQNVELIKVRGDLEKTVAQQDQELQQISAEKKELTRKPEDIEEMDERASLSPSEFQNQADDHQVEEIDNLPAELASETAAADIELVRVMLEREGVKTEAENARRENRMTVNLEKMEETERRRRQRLIDELEDKDAQLHDAQMET
ncbi:FYVE zinc finger [Peltigera leucophlebia]|nr:FYVE zinc finger [Peltigera leucophlebia]